MDKPATTAVSIRSGAAAALAQSVEHIIRNDGVTGSNPVSGTIPFSREIRDIEPKCCCAEAAFGAGQAGFGKRIGALRKPEFA